MEYVSYSPNQFYSTIHSAANNHRDGTQVGSGAVSLPTIEEEFNVFGIIWDEDFIKFYVGDKSNIIFRFNKPENPTAENWPFDKPHYFLLNLAVGGDWGGAQGVNDNNFPAEFKIDYVRVFELEEE
jgi:beta-glucanase (GH16 family)